jgi:DNA transformation protein
MDAGIQEYHDYIMYDVLDGIEGVTSKKMFGGFGLYLDGRIFAIIVSNGELYFKVDDALKEKFKKYDSHPFVYTGHKTKGAVEMPYWLLPEEIMEDKDTLYDWVQASARLSKKK